MARTASDIDSRTAAGKPPISAHPAFPAIVALWFAALLGLGSLVLPPALLEYVVTATGLPALLPSAAPPLGFGARVLIALCATFAGAIAGLAIARRIAQARGSDQRDSARFGARVPQPLNAREIMEEADRTAPAHPRKRRSLAVDENDRPSDFLAIAPLPGGDLGADNILEARVSARPETADSLELTEAVVEAPAATHGEYSRETIQTEAATDQAAASTRQELQPVAEFEETPEFAPESAPKFADATDSEPLVFSAPSLARRQEEVEDIQFDHVRLEDVQDPQSAGTFHGGWQEAALDQLGLVQLVQRLGHAIETRRDRIALARTSTVAIAPAVVHSGLEAAPAEEAAQAMAVYFGRRAGDRFPGPESAAEAVANAENVAATASMVARIGRFGDIVGDDEEFCEEDSDLSARFTLPLTASAAPAAGLPHASDPDDGQDEDFEDYGEAAAEDDGFGSLVEMRNPFRDQTDEFVRIEEPEEDEEGAFQPAVVFPNQDLSKQNAGQFAEQDDSFDPAVTRLRPFDAPLGADAAVPAETDEALRDALAKLRRMNGAG